MRTSGDGPPEGLGEGRAATSDASRSRCAQKAVGKRLEAGRSWQDPAPKQSILPVGHWMNFKRFL